MGRLIRDIRLAHRVTISEYEGSGFPDVPYGWEASCTCGWKSAEVPSPDLASRVHDKHVNDRISHKHSFKALWPPDQAVNITTNHFHECADPECDIVLQGIGYMCNGSGISHKKVPRGEVA